MNTISLKNLYLRGTFKTISPLRLNTNNYPFVTLLTANGKSHNLYFGVKTSKVIMDNVKPGESVVTFLSNADVVQTENKEGEQRFKISLGMSEYSTQAEMEQAFGSATATEFDVKAFTEQFSIANPATVEA